MLASVDDDAQLLAAWRTGDALAGKALFARYFQPLYRFFASKTDDPDELVQRTFLAIVRARDQFAGRSSFRTYLYTVGRHELYHHLRGLQRARAFDPELSSIADLVTSAGSRMARGQEHERLRAALRTLPVEQQTLLELHYWDGLDAAALAEIFETNPAAIRNRLHRARGNLREALAGISGVDAATVATVEAVDALARGAG
jgi:RNA polymerase sigma factor (sigma-70 family)